MSERASFLIVTLTGDGEIDVFGGYATDVAARAVYDKLHALLKATGTRMKLIEVPALEGVVPSAPLIPAAPLPSPSSPDPSPARVDPPKPFRSRSQAEFEMETIALLNGEIALDGVQFRDADAPLSEGGAFS